jgi:hypothetical protein
MMDIIISIMMKLTQKNIRKITRSGTSLNVSIPIEILKELKWKEKQKVVVKRIRGGVSIRDWKK